MKANDSLDNNANAGVLLSSAYGPLADYFVRFIQAYQAQGVRVDAVTRQNEPGVPSAYPGMAFPEPNESDFIARYLRPALTQAGLGTRVYGYDSNWDSPSYPAALATGPAGGDLDGISWHCYFGSPAAMTQVRALAPSLTQIVGECSPEIRQFSTAELLIGSLRNWASAVMVWNFALEPGGGPVEPPNSVCTGCEGIVTVNGANHRVRFGRKYSQLGQVSEFVHPGAVRIASTTFVTDALSTSNTYQPTSGLDDVAFLNQDGGKVLVAYNNSHRAIRFALSWHRRSLRYKITPGAMTTFIWR